MGFEPGQRVRWRYKQHRNKNPIIINYPAVIIDSPTSKVCHIQVLNPKTGVVITKLVASSTLSPDNSANNGE